MVSLLELVLICLVSSGSGFIGQDRDVDVQAVLLAKHLDAVLLEHQVRASTLLPSSGWKAEASLGVAHRARRDMPSIHMRKGNKKLRTCQNMNGILGGENAFNYVAFVVAVLTLVVNVNNNINNNNNNLNQFNLNTADNNNANANTNNNNGNVVNVMPPGKKRRRRRRKRRRRSLSSRETCQRPIGNDAARAGQASLAAVLLLQGFVRSLEDDAEECQTSHLCKAFRSAEQLGDAAGAITKIARMAASFFLSTREAGLSETLFSLASEGPECPACGWDATTAPSSGGPLPDDLKCSRCFHALAPSNVSLVSPVPPHRAQSEMRVDALFGQKNVSILEFVNPHHFRFLAVQLETLDALGEGQWNADDPWFPGYSWKIAKCPVCGQPVGWMWQPTDELDNIPGRGFYSLRLDKVLNFRSFFLGPVIEVPEIVRSLFGSIG